MKDLLENKLSRNMAVAGFLRQFESVWSANSVLSGIVTELEGLIDQVQFINSGLAADGRGFAIEKGNKRDAMMDVGLRVQSGLLAYASSVGNVVLLKQVGFTKSWFEISRDTAIIDVMQLISNTASGLVAELAPFGVDEALIDLLEEKIEAFDLYVQKPRTVVGEYAAKNKEVALLMKEIDLLLSGKLHYLLLPYRHTDQEFYDGYKKAMVIVDLGRRKRVARTKLRGRVVDLESGDVVAGVRVVVSGVSSGEMLTSGDGKYEFGFGKGGSVTIKAMKDRYYDSEFSVELKKGVVREMDVEMEKEE